MDAGRPYAEDPPVRRIVAVGGATRVRIRALAATALMALSGCAATPKPIFVAPDPPIVWPAPPQTARVRYVGALGSAADIKPVRGAFDLLGDVLIGRREAQPLYGPRDVVCGRDGSTVWVADPGGRCLHRFDLAARRYVRILSLAGRSLLAPVGLALGPGESIYVCDSESVGVYRVDRGAPEAAEELRLPVELQRPAAMYYDDARIELFVVDVSAHDIKVLDPSGRLLRILGRRGAAPGEFNYPSAITGDGRRLWIADTGNHRVQCVTPLGDHVATIGQPGDAPGDLAMPKGIALDHDGHVYVVDARFENIQVFDRDGRLLLFLGEEGRGPGEFWLPSGLFIGADGRIWVCDTYNRRIQVFEYVGGDRTNE